MKSVLNLCLVASVAILTTPDAAFSGSSKGCPPGLAKKTPACVPPGLAKKGVTARDFRERRDDYDWTLGDRLDRDRYVLLDIGDRVVFDGDEYVVAGIDDVVILRRGNDWYRLPRHRGSDYVRIGDALIRVDRETREILDLIELVDLIFG
ncbi:MAG: hypothetical protein QNJ35_18225 [Paracoccaceae bacterium]|nr:hypothetical protein [Paracoccaceae bacterium]